MKGYQLNRLKRKVDKLLTRDNGSQLAWLLAATLLVILVAIAIVKLVFNDDSMVWQDVIGAFIDSGYSLEAGPHYVFRLVLAILSTFLFSALLISVFTNLFDNVREAVANGERRYKLSHHVVVFGSGRHALAIAEQLAAQGKKVVVATAQMLDVTQDIYFFHGEQDDEAHVRSTCPDKADCIYIVGDDPADDALNLTTLSLLKQLTADASHPIHCFITLHERTSTEVYQRLKRGTAAEYPMLQVDMVDEYEYEAEQLLVNTPFLPILVDGDDRRAHFIVLGSGQMAVAMAHELAHICHYPSYARKGLRTVITLIGEGMTHCLHSQMAARPSLFALSHYRLTTAEGTTVHLPEGEDFLDVEWHFVDAGDQSPIARQVMADSVAGDDAEVRVIVCHEDIGAGTESLLHLPDCVRAKASIALYATRDAVLARQAISTGLYGDVTLFGSADSHYDLLYNERLLGGQWVNGFYSGVSDQAAAEAAWRTISEADKCSSIYCACALPLRVACFGKDGATRAVYEAEHRRWVMSELLMGWKPGEKTDKSRYVHADIVPFDKLPVAEQEKDKRIIDAYFSQAGYNSTEQDAAQI